MSIIENALKKAGKQDFQAKPVVAELLPDVDKNTVDTKATDSKLILEQGRVISEQDSGLSENNVHSGVSTDSQVVINWEKLASEGFIDHNNAKSQLAEEFRIVKRPLVNNIQGAELNGIARSNLILICSSLPGEGKTFVSINLALSIANERDKSVLLIDADVEKPSVSGVLGIKQSPGLIEYLEDERIKFTDILLKTDLPNLSVVPAGKRHKYSTELLSSQRMYLFAEEVSKRYKDRIIIFDSPPLLVATQAQILAELVGQVVLVIGAEVTPQSVVNESVAKLSNCDVVMTLLNKTRKEIDIYGHNYSYGKYGHSA